MIQPHSTSNAFDSPPAAAPRSWLRRPELVVPGVVLLAATALIALYVLERSEYLVAYLSPANILLWRIVINGGSLVFLSCWFVLFGPAPRRIRLIAALAGIATLALAAFVFRIEGNSGDLRPHLV